MKSRNSFRLDTYLAPLVWPAITGVFTLDISTISTISTCTPNFTLDQSSSMEHRAVVKDPMGPFFASFLSPCRARTTGYFVPMTRWVLGCHDIADVRPDLGTQALHSVERIVLLFLTCLSLIAILWIVGSEFLARFIWIWITWRHNFTGRKFISIIWKSYIPRSRWTVPATNNW